MKDEGSNPYNCSGVIVHRARTITAALIAVAVTGFVVAGCGSSKSSSSATSSSAASASTSSAPSSTTSSTASSATASSSSASEPTVLITTKHTSGKLGTILAFGAKKLTVYKFDPDTPMKSACYGACAEVWPPVIGNAKTAGEAHSADVGTLKRSDGTIQVTYKGHPLYLYVKDKDDGDTYGQLLKSFGAEWYTLTPTGAEAGNPS